jgi:hypothetical protein
VPSASCDKQVFDGDGAIVRGTSELEKERLAADYKSECTRVRLLLRRG